MCDTLVALRISTARGETLFGKNSDRQRNEAQVVELFPRAQYEAQEQVKCTYISIPQARHTYATLLCRPFWLWGAEMGANEHGVAIGNEAVFAKAPAPEEPALVGMDLLRLALERARTAAEAVQVITQLLEQFGQGGNCGHLQPSYYHNAFIVADPLEAFVLETVGREWLVERVERTRSISNAYSIARANFTSPGLPELIHGDTRAPEGQVHYAMALADPQKQHIGSADARRARSAGFLQEQDGELDVAAMIRILRDHGAGNRSYDEWDPACATKRTLCLHAMGEEKSGQSVGSLVSELRAKDSVHWITGTAAPCLSIFKPVLLDVRLPAHGPRATDRFDARTLWWRHERLHRTAILGDFGAVLDRVRPERNATERMFRERIDQVLNGGSAADRQHVVDQCWLEAMQIEDRWHADVSVPPRTQNAAPNEGWSRLNRLAGFGSEKVGS